MNNGIDPEYIPDSFAGVFDIRELREFEKWLHASDQPQIVFDESYIRHMQSFHGGVPLKRYFTTSRGTKHVIQRFLNFAPPNSSPLSRYGVAHTWSLLSDRLGSTLMPFAELFAGDFLCFDHSAAGRPTVVVWYHDQSRPGMPPVTESVASIFDDFLGLLKSSI